MADYYNLLEAAQKAPRATARACKSSLKLGQVAAAEIAGGALFFSLLFFVNLLQSLAKWPALR